MMLKKYQTKVSRIDRETAKLVATMLRIKCKRNKNALFETLDQNGFDQADLVLCLLRINTPTTLRYAESLIGHRIVRCPAAFKWRPLPTNLPDRTGDTRRVLSVVEDPRLRSGRRGWLPRYHLFHVGLSVSQLIRRGVTPNDLRLVKKRGWVEFSA